MRKLTFLLACLFLASVGLVNAQSRTVTGRVIYAEDEQPVIGAYVVVQGSSRGTVTDADGNFSISVPQEATILEFSFLGMKTVQAEARNGMVVRMEQEVSELDEVMVVAFGTATKKSFTGSAAVIKAEDITTRQVSNVTIALAGQVAGVQTVNTSGGQPGNAATIRIRGIGSMSASNAPLYIVDGAPFDGSMSSINPQDIESISVLKDAAANAIYGARGANGVVLITTKRGTTQEAKVNVDAKWGNNSRAVPNYAVMEDPAMYYETFYKALYNSKIYNGNSANDAHVYARSVLFDKDAGGLGYQVYTLPAGQSLIGTNFKLNPNATLGYSDADFYYTPDNWYNEIFDPNNLRQEYNVSVSGASDKINYFMSLGYLDDSGIVSGSGFSRYTARTNVEYQAKEWLKVGANIGYTNYDIQSPGSQTNWGSSGNLFYVTSLIAPIYPLYVRNSTDEQIRVDHRGITVYDFGTTTNQKRAFMGMSNPAITLKLDEHHAYTDVLASRFYGTLDLFKGMKFTASVSANTINQRANRLYNQFYGAAVASQGAVSVSHARGVGINQQYMLNYKRSFGVNGLDILAGYESYELTEQYLYGYNTKLFNPYIGELGNAIDVDSRDMTSYTNHYSTLGFIGRAEYDYDQKYILSASYRRDASSRFAPEQRWGDFGSVGAAWAINNEGFMANAESINLLKLKASYGIQGNDNIGNYYAYLDQYTVSNADGDFSVGFAYKGNPDITWETSYSFNTGIDFSMFDERLNGTIEYFSRKTVDLLYNQPVPLSFGYASIPTNVGAILNNGVEIDLRYTLVKTNNLTWDINVNATHYKNTILDLAESVKEAGGIKQSTYIYRVGGSLYNTYLREYAGVDPVTGKALYYMDPDNDDYSTTDVWSSAKQADNGSSLAKVYGGFGTALQLRGIDLSANFSYQLGGKLYDFSYEELMHSGDNAGLNWHTDILNAWTPENTVTDVPRICSSDDTYQTYSTRFMISSNYLSLNNITLGYTLPKRWTEKIKIEKLRIYAVGDNLALFSARKGFDPRTMIGAGVGSLGTAGTGSHTYTALRTISGGISLTF